jgi:hypothetical protein
LSEYQSGTAKNIELSHPETSSNNCLECYTTEVNATDTTNLVNRPEIQRKNELNKQ